MVTRKSASWAECVVALASKDDRSHRAAAALAAALLIGAGPSAVSAAEPLFPFPQNVDYVSGSLTPGQVHQSAALDHPQGWQQAQ